MATFPDLKCIEFRGVSIFETPFRGVILELFAFLCSFTVKFAILPSIAKEEEEGIKKDKISTNSRIFEKRESKATK